MSVHEKALKSIFDDLDDFESKKMFPGVEPTNEKQGFSVMITLNPNESHEAAESVEGANGDEGLEDLPANHDAGMCKGGCSYHKGGVVKEGLVNPEQEDSEELSLPPFLRKKKLSPNK